MQTCPNEFFLIVFFVEFVFILPNKSQMISKFFYLCVYEPNSKIPHAYFIKDKLYFYHTLKNTKIS